MDCQTHILENGLRIIQIPSSSQVTYSVLLSMPARVMNVTIAGNGAFCGTYYFQRYTEA